LADGETVAGQVDLVSASQSVTAARLVLGTDSGFYSAFIGRDFVAMAKWSANLPWGPIIMFFYEKTEFPFTNAVLALKLMRASPNVALTVRVLSKSSPGSVLYERSVVDTPNADSTISSEELQSLSGMQLSLTDDLQDEPFIGGRIGIGIFQYTDGTQPAAEILFDNLKLDKFETPLLGIEQAARLTWFVPVGIDYGVEGAPTPQGPWARLQETELPGMKRLSVPANTPAQFFRLREAP
jgi:hypothetical protein